MKKSRPLNVKELAILRQCSEGPATIVEMASRFRRAKNKIQANSWARNSVRRPVRLGLLKKLERGSYGITAKGKTQLENVPASKPKRVRTAKDKPAETKAAA